MQAQRFFQQNRLNCHMLLHEAAEAGYELLTQREQLLISSSQRLLGFFADDGMTSRPLAVLNKKFSGICVNGGRQPDRLG